MIFDKAAKTPAKLKRYFGGQVNDTKRQSQTS